MNPPWAKLPEWEQQFANIEAERSEEWGKRFDTLYHQQFSRLIGEAESLAIREKFKWIYAKLKPSDTPQSLITEAIYEYTKTLKLSKEEKLKIWERLLSPLWIKFEERNENEIWKGSIGSYKNIEQETATEINSIPEMTVVKRLVEEGHISQEEFSTLKEELKWKKEEETQEIIKSFLTSHNFSGSKNGQKIVENLFEEEKVIDSESFKKSDFFKDVGSHKDTYQEENAFNFFLANKYIKIEWKDGKINLQKNVRDMAERSVNDFLSNCNKDFKTGKSKEIEELKKLQSVAHESMWNFEKFYTHFKSLFDYKQSTYGFQSKMLKFNWSKEDIWAEKNWKLTQIQKLIKKWREQKEYKPLSEEQGRIFGKLIIDAEEFMNQLTGIQQIEVKQRLEALIKESRVALAKKNTEEVERLMPILKAQIGQK